MSAPRPRHDVGAFLDVVRGECAAAGVKLNLSAKSFAKDEIGSFDHETKVLSVCVSRKDWLGVLAHELGHLRQWIERRTWFESGVDTAYTVFDDWLSGKQPRISRVKLLSACRTVQKVEHDAERRAIKMIRTYKIVDDVDAHIRDANLYVWNFEVAYRCGTWPHYNEALSTVQAQMPTSLMRLNMIGKPPALLEALRKKP